MTRFEQMTESLDALAKVLLACKDSCSFCANDYCTDSPCIDGIKKYLEQEVKEED